MHALVAKVEKQCQVWRAQVSLQWSSPHQVQGYNGSWMYYIARLITSPRAHFSVSSPRGQSLFDNGQRQFLQGAPTVTIWELVFSLITQSRATHNTGEYVGNLKLWAHSYIADIRGKFQKTGPQEWFRPSVICLTKCTFFGQAHQVNLCTWICTWICKVFKYYFTSSLYVEIPRLLSVPVPFKNSSAANPPCMWKFQKFRGYP